MQLRPVILSVVPPDRQLRQRPPQEAARVRGDLRKCERAVLDEYGWCCMFCGYEEDSVVAKRMLDNEDGGINLVSQLGVYAMNGDYGDFRPDNFNVCCVFCRAAVEISEIEEPDQWAIAQLPGVPQYMLSWLARAAILSQGISDDLFALRDRGQRIDQIESGAEASFRSTIEHLSSDILSGVNQSRAFSMCTSVMQFAGALSMMQVNEPQRYAARNELLCGFRVVPKDLYIGGSWSPFAKYSRLMRDASGLGSMDTYRSMLTAARQVFVTIHKEAFPDGDPIGMTELLGTSRA